MNPIKTTVCIIGAGPGGLVTALYLAQKKIHSIIVDKDKFPRNKACGDNISGNTIRTLYEFDPGFVEQFRSNTLVSQLEGVVVYAPNNHKLAIDYLPLEKDTDLPSCYAIKRIDLDHYLIEKAKSNPYIKVIEEFSVKDLTVHDQGVIIEQKKGRGSTIQSKMVILCTGSNSPLPQKLGLPPTPNKHQAIGIRAYYDQVTYPSGFHQSELFVTRKLMPGGLYITPLRDGQVNVNIGMRSDVVKKKNVQLKPLLDQTLKEHPILKDRFKNARLIGKIEGSKLNLGTYKRKISGNRFLLVGDAAGLIDLLSANGIPQALACAKIAAEFTEKAIQSNDFSAQSFAAYDQRVYKRVENYLKLGKMIAPMMGYPLFEKATVTFMNFITKRFDQNETLRNLMYDNQIKKTLSRPSFYYKALFGIKNREAI